MASLARTLFISWLVGIMLYFIVAGYYVIQTNNSMLLFTGMTFLPFIIVFGVIFLVKYFTEDRWVNEEEDENDVTYDKNFWEQRDAELTRNRIQREQEWNEKMRVYRLQQAKLKAEANKLLARKRKKLKFDSLEEEGYYY